MYGLPKNCPRCGNEYRDYSIEGRQRVCPACKKPHNQKQASRDLPTLAGQPLTLRETQICNLLVAGKYNKEIAHELHLGEGTIKVVMSVIMAKTGQKNRTSLAIYWVFKTNEALMVAAAALGVDNVPN